MSLTGAPIWEECERLLPGLLPCSRCALADIPATSDSDRVAAPISRWHVVAVVGGVDECCCSVCGADKADGVRDGKDAEPPATAADEAAGAAAEAEAGAEAVWAQVMF